ncbi:MAG: XRE family transcriptional regulator [Candidatus Omnitrophota bacterium]
MMKIGFRIKDLRIQQRITLKDLAKKTGLTTSFLSQLERDLTSPSVSSLEKIAQALNTKIGYFFGREEEKELIFIKKGTGKKFIDKGISSETLAAGFLNIKMQPQVFTLGAGSELTKELITPLGEKFGMVFKGKLEFFCDEEKMIFEEGDSIYCAFMQRPQRVVNIGEGEAKLLWIVFLAA